MAVLPRPLANVPRTDPATGIITPAWALYEASLDAAARVAAAIVVFPVGTIMLFVQTAAPTGWTKITTSNDVGLRVVSGTASSVTSGVAFSTVFAQTLTGSHTLTTAEMPAHTHSYNDESTPSAGTFNYQVGADGSGAQAVTQTDNARTTGSTGGGGGHTHTVALNLNYIDVIQASKD